MSDENKKRQKSITCFFTKKRKIDDVENESSDETLRPTQPEESTGVGVASASSLATTTSASISYMFQERDIGRYRLIDHLPFCIDKTPISFL